MNSTLRWSMYVHTYVRTHQMLYVNVCSQFRATCTDACVEMVAGHTFRKLSAELNFVSLLIANVYCNTFTLLLY